MRAGLHTPFSSSVLVKGTSLGKSWFCTSRAIASSDSRRSFSLATTIRRPRFSVMVLNDERQLGQLVVALHRNAVGEIALLHVLRAFVQLVHRAR